MEALAAIMRQLGEYFRFEADMAMITRNWQIDFPPGFDVQEDIYEFRRIFGPHLRGWKDEELPPVPNLEMQSIKVRMCREAVRAVDGPHTQHLNLDFRFPLEMQKLHLFLKNCYPHIWAVRKDLGLSNVEMTIIELIVLGVIVPWADKDGRRVTS